MITIELRAGSKVRCGELQLTVEGPPDQNGLIPMKDYGNFHPDTLTVVCDRDDCTKDARWHPVGNIWPLGYPRDRFRPVRAFVDLNVCDDHRTACDDLKPEILESARAVTKVMGVTSPDPASILITFVPLGERRLEGDLKRAREQS